MILDEDEKELLKKEEEKKLLQEQFQNRLRVLELKAKKNENTLAGLQVDVDQIYQFLNLNNQVIIEQEVFIQFHPHFNFIMIPQTIQPVAIQTQIKLPGTFYSFHTDHLYCYIK